MKWVHAPNIRCDACPFLERATWPDSEPTAHCGHERRGSSQPIPEDCETDEDGFDPSETGDPGAYVPDWCGKLDVVATPCISCGANHTRRDDLCEACDRYYSFVKRA